MRREAAAALVLALTAGCASSPTPSAVPTTSTAAAEGAIETIQGHVDTWRDATSLPEAQEAAAQARELIDGAGGQGLLPGRDGSPGLASAVQGCAGADLLGGSWDDPQQRWTILDDAIEAWTPGNNTFPSLPSHPQRVVGWATLTERSDSLDEAHEYSGHAQLHVDAARDALADCA